LTKRPGGVRKQVGRSPLEAGTTKVQVAESFEGNRQIEQEMATANGPPPSKNGGINLTDVTLLWFVLILSAYALVHVLFKEDNGLVDVALVFWSAWITMATTGLGVIPFSCFSTESLSSKWVAVMNAFAAGMMLSASMGLIEEGLADTKDDKTGPVHSSLFRVALGLCLGVIFIWQSKNKIDEQQSFHVMDLEGLDAKKVALIMCVMTLHSLSEGIGIGVSYNSHSLGSFISLTMAVHNIPEGVAIAIVMIPKGVSKTRTALWCVFSSFPQPVMAVPAFLFVEAFRPLFSIGLGFAAGAMSYVAIFELLSDASEVLSMFRALMVTSTSALLMIFLQLMIHDD
jgi:zinc transporter, ZIP family